MHIERYFKQTDDNHSGKLLGCDSVDSIGPSPCREARHTSIPDYSCRVS